MTDQEKFERALKILEILKSFVEIEQTIFTLGEGTFYSIDIVTFNGIEMRLDSETQKLIRQWLDE